MGFSEISNIVTILTAFVPFTPPTPTTVVIADQVIIAWSAPNSNGSPLLGYQIHFREHDNGYSQQLVNCNGNTNGQILSLANCTVPLISSQVAPFNLVVGDIINAKILAYNDYGSSSMSPIGGSARMVQVPDAPINLANNQAVTTSQNISFTWSPAAFDGGTAVLDY